MIKWKNNNQLFLFLKNIWKFEKKEQENLKTFIIFKLKCASTFYKGIYNFIFYIISQYKILILIDI
jgi:hypothetical protein